MNKEQVEIIKEAANELTDILTDLVCTTLDRVKEVQKNPSKFDSAELAELSNQDVYQTALKVTNWALDSEKQQKFEALKRKPKTNEG